MTTILEYQYCPQYFFLYFKLILLEIYTAIFKSGFFVVFKKKKPDLNIAVLSKTAIFKSVFVVVFFGKKT